MRLPNWTHDKSTVEYVNSVQKLLQDKVLTIAQSYVMRKECVAAFLSVFGQSVLEYDTEEFKSTSFLFETQGFSFMARCKFHKSTSSYCVFSAYLTKAKHVL